MTGGMLDTSESKFNQTKISTWLLTDLPYDLRQVPSFLQGLDFSPVKWDSRFLTGLAQELH